LARVGEVFVGLAFAAVVFAAVGFAAGAEVEVAGVAVAGVASTGAAFVGAAFALTAFAGEALPAVAFLAVAVPSAAVPFVRDPVLFAAEVSVDPVDSVLREDPEAAAPGRLTAFLTGSTPPLGASSTTPGSGPSDAAAAPDCFALEGRRESPVLMLMGPRHGRLSDTVGYQIEPGVGRPLRRPSRIVTTYVGPPPGPQVYPDSIGQ
jgi:hypothetical protein